MAWKYHPNTHDLAAMYQYGQHASAPFTPANFSSASAAEATDAFAAVSTVAWALPPSAPSALPPPPPPSPPPLPLPSYLPVPVRSSYAPLPAPAEWASQTTSSSYGGYTSSASSAGGTGDYYSHAPPHRSTPSSGYRGGADTDASGGDRRIGSRRTNSEWCAFENVEGAGDCDRSCGKRHRSKICFTYLRRGSCANGEDCGFLHRSEADGVHPCANAPDCDLMALKHHTHCSRCHREGEGSSGGGGGGGRRDRSEVAVAAAAAATYGSGSGSVLTMRKRARNWTDTDDRHASHSIATVGTSSSSINNDKRQRIDPSSAATHAQVKKPMPLPSLSRTHRQLSTVDTGIGVVGSDTSTITASASGMHAAADADGATPTIEPEDAEETPNVIPHPLQSHLHARSYARTRPRSPTLTGVLPSQGGRSSFAVGMMRSHLLDHLCDEGERDVHTSGETHGSMLQLPLSRQHTRTAADHSAAAPFALAQQNAARLPLPAPMDSRWRSRTGINDDPFVVKWLPRRTSCFSCHKPFPPVDPRLVTQRTDHVMCEECDASTAAYDPASSVGGV